MLKADIISKTLSEMNYEPPPENSYSEEPDYDEIVIEELNRRLPEGEVRTCDDFKDLNVECCEPCHEFYPQYDMSLIELPDGAKAWVCDHVKSAIYPAE